jgi:hypothetical protein
LAVPEQYFNVLLLRTQNFVGRSKELAQLAKKLEAGSKVVIAGLGGIGFVTSYGNMTRVSS